MKLNEKQLREKLLKEELYFYELDNIMMQSGYYSVFNDGITSYIKECKNVVYTALDTKEAEIKIDFEIVINNEEDEKEESFILKVTDVSRF